MKKCVNGLINEEFHVIFRGFYNYEEVEEAVRVMRDVIVVDEIKLTGLDAMVGYSTKNGIRLKWIFNNWDCITWQYDYPENKEAVIKIKSWAEKVFEAILQKYPD